MSELNRGDLQYLEFLVQEKEYLRAQSLIGDPFALKGKLFSQRTPEALSAAVKRIRDSASSIPHFRVFLDLHILANFLLFRGDHPDWATEWLTQELDLESCFPGRTWEQILSGHWTQAPVIAVHEEAWVLYFITGLFPGTGVSGLWPEWADALMDSEGKSAVEAAASAAESISPSANDRVFFCYPLVAPGETIQLKGSSLGLSVALAFLSLAKAKPLPTSLAATGSLTGTRGSVGDAQALEKKAECAEKRGFRVFLYPSCGNPPAISRGLELLPVSDLSEAWMFAQLYAPGKARDLTILSRMLKSPEVFVNNVDLIEPEWLKWVKREGKGEEVLKSVLASPKQFSIFVGKLEWGLENWKLEQGHAMAGLVPKSEFRSAASRSALTALRFCTQNVALSNHRGDVSTAAYWANEGERVFEKALKADINACADFLNNHFIMHHNRYEFVPSFPEKLKAILGCLQNRYAAQCAGGCIGDRTLGELYGSICQNFGFCGPQYLSECETYAQKAVDAFGGGDVPELIDEVLRQFSNLAYAMLDAGDHEKAKAALLTYLEVEGLEDLCSEPRGKGLSRWEHALVARFLSKTPVGDLHKSYLTRVFKERAELVKGEHPWQLWTFNVGLLAQALEEREKAEACHKQSLELCLSDGFGPTVHVMALLPLSALWKLRRLSRVDLAEAKGRVLESAEILNPTYFRILRENDFEEILKVVWEKPERLFPFSYR